MIPLPHRQKGGGPQLGASRPGERGPYGWYGALEDAERGEDDDGQDHDDEGDCGDRHGDRYGC